MIRLSSICLFIMYGHCFEWCACHSRQSIYIYINYIIQSEFSYYKVLLVHFWNFFFFRALITARNFIVRVCDKTVAHDIVTIPASTTTTNDWKRRPRTRTSVFSSLLVFIYFWHERVPIHPPDICTKTRAARENRLSRAVRKVRCVQVWQRVWGPEIKSRATGVLLQQQTWSLWIPIASQSRCPSRCE